MAALLVLAFLSIFGGGFGEYTTARMLQKHYQEYPDHYAEPIPVTEPEIDHYYAHTHPTVHRFRPPPSEKGLDLTTLGILAIIKLLLVKIKGMGLIFLLMLKLPALLFTFFGKFLFLFKVAKVLKLLAIPLLLLALLPLLLGPLLLLAPFLLPLLLALPIPVLQPASSQAAAAGRRRRRDLGDLQFLQTLLESEKCLERIACVLAADKEPNYTSTIVWGLDRLKLLIPHPKFSNYVSSYRDSATNRFSIEKCYRKYPCHKFLEKETPHKLMRKDKKLDT